MNKSCSQCENESDNKHALCPAKMEDGRQFTDYRPRCAMHEGKNMNSYDARQYMINNAEQLMSADRKSMESRNRCGPCVEPWNQGTMLPEQTMTKCTAQTCTTFLKDPYGLGQGRDFGITPDAAFVAKMEKNNSAMMRAQDKNCCTGYDEDIQYYPLGNSPENLVKRSAVPGGGDPFSSRL